MRPMILAFALALALPAAAVADVPGGSAAPSPRLQGAQCLDPEQARGWTLVDSDHLLVDAGRYKYRIEVASACTALGYSQVIAFRGDPIGGRVCGSVHDAVVTRDYPCRIDRLELLSKEQYQQALKDYDAARKARKAARAAAKQSKSP